MSAKINWLDPEFLAQEVHGSIGFGYTLAAFVFLPLIWAWVAWFVLEFVVLVKEYWWDPAHETTPPQPWLWQGVEDFAFYQPGVGLAILLLVLAHRPV